MKKLILLAVSLIFVGQGFSQIQYSNQNSAPSDFIQNLSGPRVGVTVITNGRITDVLDDEFGVNTNFITQFGYQYEKQIMGNENVAGLVEGILLIGGLEQGLFLPSLSGMFGARFASGFEFAVGPNLSVSGAALVLGIGKTIHAGNINIPISFSWVPSVNRRETDHHDEYDEETGDWIYTETTTTEPMGHRFSLTIGFNFRTR
jgi:hypothetical protein